MARRATVGTEQDPGAELPAPTPFGPCVGTVQTGSVLFLSGMLPIVDHKRRYPGLLAEEPDAGAGCAAVCTTALSALTKAKRHSGGRDKVSRVVRLGVFVATSGDSFDVPKVAEALSELFRDIFGTEQTAVRLVISVASLPIGMPVELEIIFEVAA